MTLLLLACAASQEIAVDLSRHDPACGVRLERRAGGLRAEWTADGGVACAATFALAPGAPLLSSLEAGGKVLARDVDPRYVVTVGTRIERANERYIFFDKPAKRPTKRHEAALATTAVRAESAGRRTSLAFAGLAAGPFSGELAVTIYAGSPLLHVEAAMGVAERLVAYVYDFVLEGTFSEYAWKDTADRFVRVPAVGEPRPRAVRHRAVFGRAAAGALAVFPPPHAFFFPRDHTDNFEYAQAGGRRFGLRQDPDRKNAFVPWIDAPAGRVQRMGAFVLLHPGEPEEALERVKAYTRGDRFKEMDGRRTFTSHWHLRLAVAEMAGKPRAPEAAKVFKAMNVNLVHLAEFHGDGSPRDPGPKRLPGLAALPLKPPCWKRQRRSRLLRPAM